MTDLINRADAIEAVDERWGDIKRTNKRVAKGHEAVYLDMRATISALPSADAVQGYTEWLEKIIVDNEGANEWLCEDTPDLEWCEKNCHYSSIQAECLRHLYEVSKGGAE